MKATSATKALTIFRVFLVAALFVGFFGFPATTAHAGNPDVIGQYIVTVRPQPDGTLALRYEFKNYCATTDFPSPDFYIGMPNSNFTITATGGDLGGDTSWVKQGSPRQSGEKAYVDFRETPRATQCFNFWYEITQRNMAHPQGDTELTFQYRPSWFDFATITHLEIHWQLPADQSQVHLMDPKPANVNDGYATWTYDNMDVNAQTDMLNFVYAKAAFPNYDEQAASADNGGGMDGAASLLVVILVIVVVFLFICFVAYIIDEGGGGGGGGYYGGGSSWSSTRGSGYGGSSGRSSSCACVSSCACACACAGGGRAGCSAKGFILPKKAIDRILKRHPWIQEAGYEPDKD